MKLLIVGYKPKSIKNSKSSVQLITQGIFEGFEKIHMDVECRSIDDENLPNADIVLVIAYVSDSDKLPTIKLKTSAKKLITLRECPFKHSDYCFITNPRFRLHETVELIDPPYYPTLKYTEKESKTILIDHYWEDYLGTENDRTKDIEDWLQQEDYKVYRMIRYESERNNILKYQIPFELSPYTEYIEMSNHIENFIVTHREGFPYGVIDMVVRGTRVFTPPNFIPKVLIDKFNINVFTCKEELLYQLEKPINIVEQRSQIDKCISYDNLARLIYERIETRLGIS